MPKQIIDTKRPGKLQGQHSIQAELSGLFGCEARVSATGLVLIGNVTFDRWKLGANFFREFRLASEGMHWLLADWLAYGGEKFCETDSLTGKYKQTPAFSRYLKIAELTGFEESSLKQLAYVGRAVPIAVRLTPSELSFSHHQQVAPLDNPDEQRQWLEKAKAGHWTVSELRQAIRRHMSENDRQGALPLIVGVNLVGLAGELESRFRKLEENMPLDKWPAEQRLAIKSDAIKIRDVADGIIARIV